MISLSNSTPNKTRFRDFLSYSCIHEMIEDYLFNFTNGTRGNIGKTIISPLNWQDENPSSINTNWTVSCAHQTNPLGRLELQKEYVSELWPPLGRFASQSCGASFESDSGPWSSTCSSTPRCSSQVSMEATRTHTHMYMYIYEHVQTVQCNYYVHIGVLGSVCTQSLETHLCKQTSKPWEPNLVPEQADSD